MASPEQRCSFCALPRGRVKGLIAGDQHLICTACVGRFRAQLGPRALPPPGPELSDVTAVTEPSPTSERERLAALADYFPTMVREGLAQEDELGAHLSSLYGVPYIDLSATPVAPEVAGLISGDLAHAHGVLPLALEGDRLRLAMRDPLDQEGLRAVEAATGRKLAVSVCDARALDRALAALHPVPPSRASRLPCSFCGRWEYEPGRLVVEGEVAICDPCLSLCEDILAERDDLTGP